MKHIFKYLILVFLFIVSTCKINAEPLPAGEYKIGDKVTYHGIQFYVIANSTKSSDSVTLLKAEPLTVDEVNVYGRNIINKYPYGSYDKANNNNGYGEMAYYSSGTCGYLSPNNYYSYQTSGCKNNYDDSQVKYVIDAWSKDRIKTENLKVDSTNYSARLMTASEVLNNLGCDNYNCSSSTYKSWLYNSNYITTLMGSLNDSENLHVWGISSDGYIYNDYLCFSQEPVRPVVTLNKIVKSNGTGENNQKKYSKYKIGDKITYKGIDFFVIIDSDENNDSVTLLKEEPLTVDEVNKYGVGHVNMYYNNSTISYNKEARDINGYGGMAYYSSETCSHNTGKGCTTDYDKSEIKYVVDAWAKDNFNLSYLKNDLMGYKVRLLTVDDLVNNVGYQIKLNISGNSIYEPNPNTPTWLYNSKYSYWTMSTYLDSNSIVYVINNEGRIFGEGYGTVESSAYVVRPVINLQKMALEVIDNETDSKIDNINNESQIVTVPDTLKNKIILFSIIGGTLIFSGLIIVFIIFKTKLSKKKMKEMKIMKRKTINHFMLILLFILSIGKIKAEPLAPGSYKIGDEVIYNDMKFYVIANSDKNSDSVTMLKAEPFTVDEVNKYGVGHINRYIDDSVGTASDENGYGGMAYYSSPTCGNVGSFISTGCTNDYSKSEVKYAVDSWAKDKLKSADLKVDSTGYSARLLTHTELIANLGYIDTTDTGKTSPSMNGTTPSWVYNNNYWYWTMGQYGDSSLRVWIIEQSGHFGLSYSLSYTGVVRPVVTLKKVVESDKLQPGDNDINSSNSDKESSNTIQKVDVPDTLKNRVIMFSIIGSAMIIVGLVTVVLILKNKRSNKNRNNREEIYERENN